MTPRCLFLSFQYPNYVYQDPLLPEIHNVIIKTTIIDADWLEYTCLFIFVFVYIYFPLMYVYVWGQCTSTREEDISICTCVSVSLLPAQ